MLKKKVSYNAALLKWQEKGLPAEGGFRQRAAYINWSHLQGLLFPYCSQAAEKLMAAGSGGLWLWILFLWHHFYNDFSHPF